MKRWVFIFSLILALLALVAVFFALRPVFSSDVMTDVSNLEKSILKPTDEREQSGLLSFTYNWDLSTPPNHTLLMGNESPDIFRELQPAVWKISCYQENGQYKLRSIPPILHAKNSTCQVRSRFLAEFGTHYKQRHPDGTIHPVRSLKLVCELWIYRPFFQKPQQAFAMQEIRLDLIDGTADIFPPISYLFSARGMKHRIESGTSDADLPSRHCGTEREQLFSQILFLLASIDSKLFAEVCTKDLLKKSKNLLVLQSAPDAPWPDCWGDDAPLAQKTARRLIPTLLRMQEHACYEHQPLADFINSDTFSRIFGESFAATPTPISDMPPIIFERVNEEKMKNK